MTAERDVEALFRALLTKWNEKDAGGYGELFTDDGSIVGYDGSCVESPRSITEHLGSIFADHDPATYVGKVVETRPIGPSSMLVRGVAGMVPPGASDIDPDKNAVQALVAVETERGWRIAHFQNTPAAFDGRPEAAESLTADLRAALSSP
ncbi:MAG: SgcJ/EcaC family oxidoreductase [Acidimicrobiales bacterium]